MKSLKLPILLVIAILICLWFLCRDGYGQSVVIVGGSTYTNVMVDSIDIKMVDSVRCSKYWEKRRFYDTAVVYEDIIYQQSRKICKECESECEFSAVYIGMSTRTLMCPSPAYYDELGFYHPSVDENKTKTHYSCSRGHTWTEER